MDNEISESSSPVFTRTSTVSRKEMDNDIFGSSSVGTGDSSRDLSYDSGYRGDDGGVIQKTRSPMYKMYTRDKHDYDDLNKS